MADFHDKLAAFHGQRCALQITEALAPSFAGQRWSLYVFDWSAAAPETQEAILARTNQEADSYHPAFAIVNPSTEIGSLEDLVEAAQDGFLLVNAEGDTIYVGDGNIGELTTEVDEFVDQLAVSDEFLIELE